MEESIWVNPIWYAGLLEAMRNWNSINSNIKLHLISDSYYTSERIDITIRSDDGTLPSSYATQAEFTLFSGQPGSLIIVNTDFKNPYTNSFITYAQAAWNIQHEIGHCLGLRHTNWYLDESSSPYGAIHIPGTPTTNGDAFSVMNSGTALNS